MSVLSSRDADMLTYTLSFIISFGLPSRISCHNPPGNQIIFDDGGGVPGISREVIRSRYISSSEPDMTRVTITLTRTRTAAVGAYVLYVCCWS